jgi:hypothetical protein
MWYPGRYGAATVGLRRWGVGMDRGLLGRRSRQRNPMSPPTSSVFGHPKVPRMGHRLYLALLLSICRRLGNVSQGDFDVAVFDDLEVDAWMFVICHF